MRRELTELIHEGERALEAGEWAPARSAFEAALAIEESAEALDGHGLVLWFLGDLNEGVAERERAFTAYVRAGEGDRAARAAAWISRQYHISGRPSAARGWLSRGERAVASAPAGSGRGWIEVEHARLAGSVEDCIRRAQLALDTAREFGDDDLEVFALSVLGRAEVSAGRMEEGARKLDEAMAAATAGRVRNVHTLGDAYCNLIMASTSAGDWERAAEWCQSVDGFATGLGLTVLIGACRTVHADVLVASGRWDDAEAALQSALGAHERGYPAMAAPAISSLASLRIRQGRLAEAEQLLAGRDEQPVSLLAVAELRLAQAEPRSAAALLERALAGTHGDVLVEARLLTALVDAQLATGQIDSARQALRRLEELAGEPGRRLVGAQAELAAARVALEDGRQEDAQAHAGAALAEFGALEMPYESADARLELARALENDLPELARDEAGAAFATFKELGAARGMDAAAAVLRDLGSGAGGGARTYGELTARERDVLALLARGMTNAAIAKTLFISEKTAGHHVSRILSKLGARNRAEAAAYATRAGLLPNAAATGREG